MLRMMRPVAARGTISRRQVSFAVRREPVSSIIDASTSTVWTPRSWERCRCIAQELASATEQLQTRLYAVTCYEPGKGLAHGNVDPSKGTVALARDIRRCLSQAFTEAESVPVVPLPRGGHATNPLLNSAIWAIGLVQRSFDALPLTVPTEVRAAKEVLSDLPSALPLYASVVQRRLSVEARTSAFSTTPNVDLPQRLWDACVDRGEWYDIDPSRAQVEDLAPLLLPLNVKSAFQRLFTQVRSILDAAHINYWPTGGTLLGSLRHGDMIPWDDDIDICVCPDPGESTSTFDQRLRAAIGFPYAAECAPLFGYKIYDTASDLGAADLQHCKFGVFVDLFVMCPLDAAGGGGAPDASRNETMADESHVQHFRLAYPTAAQTWPREIWGMSEVDPLRPATFGSQSRFKVACRSEAYLDRMFSPTWSHVCVVPRSAHGRTLMKELRFPMSFWKQYHGPT